MQRIGLRPPLNDLTVGQTDGAYMEHAWEFGEILVLDCRRHVVCGRFEIAAAVADARRTMNRPPEVNLSNIVSWGNLTPDEAASLIACEPIEDQGDALLLFEELLASVSGLQTLWSLTYAEETNG
jgi:hypothetical protein